MKKGGAAAVNPSMSEAWAAPGHFALFSLPVSFAVNDDALEREYFSLQRQYHPDRAAHLLPAKRLEAATRSMQINEAYQTLKSPLRRAQYLLRERGVHVGGENDTIKPSQALLQQVMAWREAADEGSEQGIARLGQQLALRRSEIVHALTRDFSMEAWEQAALHTLELGYVEKILYALRQKSVRIA